MGLRTKLNLLLLLVTLLGAATFAAVSAPVLQMLARDEVVQSSRIMMEAAAGARDYTSNEVAPLVLADMAEFHPQAVSAYAATRSFAVLHQRFPDYSYREVALNPTNPEDRPADWESDIVQYFRNNPARTEVINTRGAFLGEVLTLSRPVKVAERCLACHDKATAAPASMTAKYGSDHGFGWKTGEIIGAQIVSVPMSLAYDRALKAGLLFTGLFVGVMILLAIVLNIGLGVIVIGPVMKMAGVAEQVSMGKMDAPDYKRGGRDQISKLNASFNRMRRSLEEAMKMLSGPR